jgi:hypothetical protein
MTFRPLKKYKSIKLFFTSQDFVEKKPNPFLKTLDLFLTGRREILTGRREILTRRREI